MKGVNKENMVFGSVMLLAIALFFYMILGFAGAVSALAIILVFLIPTYFIFDNFSLETDEKLVFSFFVGVGVFPSIAYWLGLFVSFKLAIVVTFAVLIAAGFLIKKLKK